MDASKFDNVKAEKARAMRRYNRLRSVGELFRLFEVFVALLFLCWSFARVPFAVRISGEFFFRVAGVIASPLFVFLLSNVIIATLIAKSGGVSAGGRIGDGNVNSELYEKIVNNSEIRLKTLEHEDDKLSADEIVYQDKEIICEVSAIARPRREKVLDMESGSDADLESGSEFEVDNAKVYRRTKSDKLARESEEKVKRALRRSETEKCRKTENRYMKLYSEDEMSNEEFQRTIEEFIAKQLRFRREETLAVVLQTQA